MFPRGLACEMTLKLSTQVESDRAARPRRSICTTYLVLSLRNSTSERRAAGSRIDLANIPLWKCCQMTKKRGELAITKRKYTIKQGAHQLLRLSSGRLGETSIDQSDPPRHEQKTLRQSQRGQIWPLDRNGEKIIH